jgi:uncharacterized YccA/Bax inhibitor family protein
MRAGNPALSADVFRIEAPASAGVMTMTGAVGKTAVLLALTVAAAAVSWAHIIKNPDVLMPYVWGGLIVGLVLSLVIVFKPATAAFTAPIYAIAEGLFLGAFSFFADQIASQYGDGGSVILPAVTLTFGTLATMLIAYALGFVRATEKFKMGVIAATGAVALVFLATMILRLFGMNIPYIHENGIIGIGFSLIVLVIAALNLVLDFDLIESGAKEGAPKYMEWYGGFALLVTLVWLYIRFVDLLLKLQSRD